MKYFYAIFIFVIVASGVWELRRLMATPTIDPAIKKAAKPPKMKCRRVVVEGTPWDVEFNDPGRRGFWLCNVDGKIECVLGMGCR